MQFFSATKKTLRHGFTMIELMVVIAIIGVLSSLGVWASSKLFSDADAASHSAMAGIVKSAIESYRTEHNALPEFVSDVSNGAVVYGQVQNNRLARSNAEFILELLGRDSNGQKDSSKRAYITDSSSLYVLTGRTIQKLDEATSITSNSAIGFPVRMRKTSASKYKEVSGRQAFAPIQIEIDYDLDYVTVTVGNESTFDKVIRIN